MQMLSPSALTVINRSFFGPCALKQLGCGRLFRAGHLVFLLWSLAEGVMALSFRISGAKW